VVDDTDLARYNKVHALRKAGFEVIEAATGNDALELMRSLKPRLVVLDVKLPDISGWDVCKRIKADPATASILVLQMSATYVNRADTVLALEGGADACLTEPLEPPVLVATVRALLRARRAEDALRESLEREKAANRSKDDFLAVLSHELRSPLSAILTWAAVLRTGKADAATFERGLEAIDRNTRLQMKVIGDLLDISRIVSGKIDLDRELVDVATVVEGALENIGPSAHEKEIAIEVSVGRDAGLVRGDSSRLQQIVINLLSNAVKFTPPGGRVSVSVARQGTDTQVEVSDNGQGIPPEFLSRIFDRFEQGDASTTRLEGGLGLGLAIVRHLTELHGGNVRARSAGPGQGSTFTVSFPTASPPRSGEMAAFAGARPVAALPDLGGLEILIVDDDGDSRESMAALLEQCGAHVETARNSDDAIAALERSAPHVLISDIAMPHEDGLTFIRRARALEPARSIPAIAITASSIEVSRVLEAGFNACLAKPIEASDFVQAIAQLDERSCDGRSSQESSP
jgi:signal transduction histidine kinase